MFKALWCNRVVYGDRKKRLKRAELLRRRSVRHRSNYSGAELCQSLSLSVTLESAKSSQFLFGMCEDTSLRPGLIDIDFKLCNLNVLLVQHLKFLSSCMWTSAALSSIHTPPTDQYHMDPSMRH